ncbi:MAG TPA: SGNH/GDSL hydrolase family protein, partial [Acidimicrobiales bacterium]|nr:SGNH/GDSL hydrolase family protein [Acidimicrobiales bacterium]
MALAFGFIAMVASPLQEASAGGSASSSIASTIDSLPSNSGTGGLQSASASASGRRPMRVLLVGDSVALTLGIGLSEGAAQRGIDFSDQATLGCGVAQGEPLEVSGQTWTAITASCNGSSTDLQWPLIWADDVSSFNPDVVLLSVGRWEVVNRFHNGQWTNITNYSFQEYLANQLSEAIRVLSTDGAHVVLVTSPYFQSGNYAEDSPARVDEFNTILRKVATQYPSIVSVLDLNSQVDPNGRYASSIGNIQIRNSDGVHFTSAGGIQVGQWMWPLVQSIGDKAEPNGGYEVVTSRGQVLSDGSVSWHGDSFDFPPVGSTANVASPPSGFITSAVPTSDGGGYWLVSSIGGVYAFGDANFYGPGTTNLARYSAAPLQPSADQAQQATGSNSGSAPVQQVQPVSSGSPIPPGIASSVAALFSSPVVALAPSNADKGYWLATSSGSVFAYGGAKYYPPAPLPGSGTSPSVPNGPLRKKSAPIVAMSATPDGHGYWLVGSDGSVYGFGDARYFSQAAGSSGGSAPTGSGGGSAAGPTSGGAPIAGLSAPIVAMSATPDGHGYWLVGSDGSVYG